MVTVQTWVLGGALVVAATILAFLSKSWFNNISNKLESIVSVLNDIKIALNSHDKDIEYMKGDMQKMNDRLNSHGDRIHELESQKLK